MTGRRPRQQRRNVLQQGTERIDRHLTSYPEADLHRRHLCVQEGGQVARQSVTIKSRVPLAAGNSSPNLTLIHGREAASGRRNPASV